MTNDWLPGEEQLLAQYLVDQVVDRATGRNQDECWYNFPRDCYFIGNLRPMGDNAVNAMPSMQELVSKIAPVALGAEFRVRPQNGISGVEVGVKWSCYYRIFPSFEQQYHHQHQTEQAQPSEEPPSLRENAEAQIAVEENEGTGEEHPEEVEVAARRRQRRAPADKLFIRFRKIPCYAQATIAIAYQQNQWQADLTLLAAALADECARAQSQAMADPERLRTEKRTDERVSVPDAVIASPDNYHAFLQQLATDVVPEWAWRVEAELRPNEMNSTSDEQLLFLRFSNDTVMDVGSPNTEPFLFDVQVKIDFSDCVVLPYTLELAPRGFRYDRNLWGRGFNCAVEHEEGDHFRLFHAPVFPQLRYQTCTVPPARFDQLSQDPMPVLESIREAMQNYRAEWETAYQQYIQLDPEWDSRHFAEFDKDRQLFEQEIDRFSNGLRLIRDNPDVRLAFQLTNETFRLAGQELPPRRPKTQWRLFQIVFLVGQIPGIAALASPGGAGTAEREQVDIIYFPTGGGKTEAYLATIVFHCFFDRLRGKRAGVTSWVRFPLRLLTLQQTQRAADIIATAELVRRRHSDSRLSGHGVAGFAVGYFVGQSSTPNELVPPRQGASPELDWSIATDEEARQQWKRIIRCPSCRTNTVRVDFDPQQVRVIHRCTQPNCAFPGGVIPVYVVDNEIYRFLPTVIVGTIDKLAGVGNQRKFSLIMGMVEGRCSVHGYYSGKCCQKDCTDRSRLHRQVPAGLSGPTLFVQDELHLLKEGLGTFDGHYETFTQRLLNEAGQTTPLKIIASSATIEAFAHQVEHLYGRPKESARVFPSLGPTLGQSFYAETLNYPQRLYVGVIPHNKTILNAILEIIQYYHEAIQNLQRLREGDSNPYGGELQPGTQSWAELLDLYVTSLTYFSRTKEVNGIHTDLENAVNSDLLNHGYSPLTIRELTGDTTTADVTDILSQLEAPLSDSRTAPNAILATSMVSHGVDIDRFNTMIFYGMPTQNAEYIQASSRVGRAHVGIVFNCLHPARERDQSHYTYFAKYHEFLGQLVEPVAINRWSKFSVTRTLPGLFMAVLLQIIANRGGQADPNRYYMLDFVKQQISNGSITVDDFIPFLEESYQVLGRNEVGPATFSVQIRQQVAQFLRQILAASSQHTFVSDALIPQPMNSLREVDEQLEVELDSNGSRWSGNQ